MNLKEYLNKPTYAIDRPWVIVLLNSMVVALILAIFEPFHYRLNSVIQFWVLWCFVGLTFIFSVVAFVLFPKLFKRFYDPERWTIGKNLLHCSCFLLFLGLACFIYDYYFLMRMDFWSDLDTTIFYKMLLIDVSAAITIVIIPLIFGFFIIENNALKRNLQEAIRMNKLLSERNIQEEKGGDAIILSGDTKESICVLPDNIMYMESSGNYVDVCYREEGNMKHKLLRSTIKQMDEMMEKYGCFVRCHRAYIVNVNKIMNINGNAQGYRLNLEDTQQEIPVSRTYLKDFKSFLNKEN